MKDLVDEVNELYLRDRGVMLDLHRWETDSYPNFHAEGPQGHIDERLRIPEANIFVGIFWKRFGTLVKDGKTGTEHEIGLAIETWKRSKRLQLMLYFKEQPYMCHTKEEAEQWGRVIEFKNNLPPEGFWWTYQQAGENSFEKLFRRHLVKAANAVLNPHLEGVEASIDAGGSASLFITNSTGKELEIDFVERDGKLVGGRPNIPPGHRVHQPTYIGHVWVLRSPDHRQAIVKAMSAYQEVEIHDSDLR